MLQAVQISSLGISHWKQKLLETGIQKKKKVLVIPAISQELLGPLG